MGIEHAYWSSTSNLEILNRANWMLNGQPDCFENWVNFIVPKHKNEKQIKLISEVIENKKIKLLGHIIRSDEKDPLYQTTFTTSGEFQAYKKQRVGRPRGWWAEEAMGLTLERLEGQSFDKTDTYQRAYIFSQGLNRQF